MQTDNRLLDDLARVAAGAVGVLAGVREEVEARLRQQFERVLDGMELVNRAEFDAVQAKRLAELEAAAPGAAAKSRAEAKSSAAPTAARRAKGRDRAKAAKAPKDG